MKRFLWLLIVIALATALGFVILKAPGYVLLHVNTLSIASPLWLFILGLAIIIAVSLIAWRLGRSLWHFPNRLHRGWKKRQRQKQDNLLLEAFNHVLLEDWPVTEKLFKKLADMNFMRHQSLLIAAQSAKRCGNRQAQIDYLHQASRLKTKKDGDLILLAQVDALIEEQKWQQAEQKISTLLTRNAKNAYALYRHFDILLRLEKWTDAIDVLSQLKSAPLDDKKRERMTNRAYKGLIKRSSEKSKEALLHTWPKIPKTVRKQSVIHAYYIGKLLKLGLLTQAEESIRKTLEQNWDERLFALYGYTQAKDTQAQLERAESWWKNITPTASGLLSLGYLCYRNKIYPRAKEYFERSIAVTENTEAYIALGKVQLDMNQTGEALNSFRQAALLKQQPGWQQ